MAPVIGILGIVGSVVSAGAAVLGGIQASRMASFQSAMAQRQAEIAEDNAKRATQRAQIEQEDQDMISLAWLGEQEALMSASGLGGRSQQLARKSSREIARRDALNIRHAGDVERYNFQQQAANSRAEASMHKSAGRYSLLEGFMGGVTSLIGSAKPTKAAARYNMRATI